MRKRALDAALDEFVEALREVRGGLAGDGDVLIVEDGLWLAGKKECERAVVPGEGVELRDATGASICVSKS